jgi:hypothetical protein
MIVADQDAYDIIQRIIIKHKNCAGQYDKIAADFDARDIMDVCHKLWAFCKNNLAYQEETINKQDVSSPQTILKRGYCDCKGYALFIGGVLDALNRQGGWNIKWFYRFASDDIFNSIPGHVFVVVVDQGQEIWVDPVLSSFNADHYFPYYEDKRVRAAVASMGGCECEPVASIGATGQETGQMIAKIAPALAVVPVIGWVAAGAGELIGGFLMIFGSKYEESTNVRWLTQIFEVKVLGWDTKSDNSVAKENIATAQKWFSTVLGVPIYDQFRYWTLRGQDMKTLQMKNVTHEDRAREYLKFPDVAQSGTTFDQALEATYIADTMDPRAGKKAWAGATAAPSLIDKSGAALHVDASGNLVTASGQAAGTTTAGGNKIILIAAAAAIAFILIKK